MGDYPGVSSVFNFKEKKRFSTFRFTSQIPPTLGDRPRIQNSIWVSHMVAVTQLCIPSLLPLRCALAGSWSQKEPELESKPWGRTWGDPNGSQPPHQTVLLLSPCIVQNTSFYHGFQGTLVASLSVLLRKGKRCTVGSVNQVHTRCHGPKGKQLHLLKALWQWPWDPSSSFRSAGASPVFCMSLDFFQFLWHNTNSSYFWQVL